MPPSQEEKYKETGESLQLEDSNEGRDWVNGPLPFVPLDQAEPTGRPRRSGRQRKLKQFGETVATTYTEKRPRAEKKDKGPEKKVRVTKTTTQKTNTNRSSGTTTNTTPSRAENRTSANPSTSTTTNASPAAEKKDPDTTLASHARGTPRATRGQGRKSISRSQANIKQEEKYEVSSQASPNPPGRGQKRKASGQPDGTPKQARKGSPGLIRIEALPDDGLKQIVFSGVDAKLPRYTQMVTELGGKVVASAADCTHLVMPRGGRTIKLLTAINCCKHVITGEWIEDSYEKSSWRDEREYCLKDKNFEKEFGFDLQESLERAQTMPAKIFDGVTFYLTKECKPEPADLKVILAAAGARAHEMPARKSLPPNSIILTTPEKLKTLTNRKSEPVYTTEFVMSSILKQEIDWEKGKLL